MSTITGINKFHVFLSPTAAQDTCASNTSLRLIWESKKRPHKTSLWQLQTRVGIIILRNTSVAVQPSLSNSRIQPTHSYCSCSANRHQTAKADSAQCDAKIPRYIPSLLWVEQQIFIVPGRVFQFLSWFHILGISLFSCILLSVLNILLIRCIHKTASRKRHLNQHYTPGFMTSSTRSSDGGPMPTPVNNVGGGNVLDETRLTRMFIILICVFVIGELPSALLSRGIVVAFVGGDQSKQTLESSWYQIASMIATILVVSQHSANFIIYSLLNIKFRTALYDTFCPSWRKNVGFQSTNDMETFQNNNLDPLQVPGDDMEITHMNHCWQLERGTFPKM